MLVNESHSATHDESAILHPSSRALFRFWEQMRAEHAAPRRDQLDLTRIKPLVPNLMIAAYDHAAGTYRWRLAGSGICEIYRQELTGLNLLWGWDSFETNVVMRFLAGVVHHQQPCLIRYRLMTDLGQTIGAELIGLPILASDGHTVHVFGGVFPFREIASLGYSGISMIELSGARSIWTEKLPASAAATPDSDIGVSTSYLGLRVIPGGRQ